MARGIHEKLVRRHPHVFGDARADSAGAVKARWEDIKRSDEGREGIFHHVPETLPALLYARKVQRRAAAVGFEYLDTDGAVADLDDELRERAQIQLRSWSATWRSSEARSRPGSEPSSRTPSSCR